MAQWLEREFADRKVRSSNPTSTSQLPLPRLGQRGSIPALLPSGGMAARHRKVHWTFIGTEMLNTISGLRLRITTQLLMRKAQMMPFSGSHNTWLKFLANVDAKVCGKTALIKAVSRLHQKMALRNFCELCLARTSNRGSALCNAPINQKRNDNLKSGHKNLSVSIRNVLTGHHVSEQNWSTVHNPSKDFGHENEGSLWLMAYPSDSRCVLVNSSLP
ncbi:hypothetical protein CSKR_100603 [Clonorchis sinensis]|uniref:Uncharacterized protein n=1 Tax=Clonorchis sinensis TaxID=79923 RepID=A0A419PFX1_CLOSI|nr:hypothetical protein CSKR_100603 [Clonorchis sinensis]